jgi:hypothetical protein
MVKLPGLWEADYMKNTREKTNETLYEAFRTHVKLKHSEEFNLAAIPATERHEA